MNNKEKLLKLTKKQQKYVLKFQKSFQDCIDNNIRFYHVMETMTAYNAKYVRGIAYTHYPDNKNRADELINDDDFYASISHNDLDGWADDPADHEVVFKEGAL